MNFENGYIGVSETFYSVFLEEKAVFFLGERQCHMSDSRLIADVTRCVDGTKSIARLIQELSDLPPEHIHFAVSQMCRQGVFRCLDTPETESETPASLMRDVGGIQLVSDSPAALDLMEKTLVSAARSHDLPIRGQIVLTSDFRAPFGKPGNEIDWWIPVKLTGERSYFGPVFSTKEPSCPDCLQRRLRINRPIETFLGQALGRHIGPPVSHRWTLSRFATETARAVCLVLCQAHSDKEDAGGSFVTEYTRDGILRHDIGRPGCPRCRRTTACGGPTDDVITSRVGGYRSRSAAAVLSMLRPQISDLTGLISSIGPLDTGTDPAGSPRRHVWAASFPVLPGDELPPVDGFHGTALGKGITAEQAEVSALCEAIERQSAQYPDHIAPRRASLRDLEDAAIDPNRVWQFSDSQFVNRAFWNGLSDDTRRHVPLPLDRDVAIDWIPVRSLNNGRDRWMARDLCFANAPDPKHGRFDPNGCAARSTVSEAILQGALELVERDSVAIWWYNRIHRPGLMPEAFPDDRLRHLADGFRSQGWECWLLDLTTDLEIPCYAALARADLDGRWCIGFGCHLDGGLAAQRAMTELSQLFRADGRDGPPPWAPMQPKGETYLFPQGQASVRDAPVRLDIGIDKLVSWLATHLAAHGHDLLVLDQTRPDTGFPVVKTFAPGLCHFWPRFGARRLYEVPVRMRWQASPTSETDLNATHLFL